MPRARISHQFANDFGCAGAIMYGHTHREITRIIGPAEQPLAQDSKTTAHRCIFAGKARSGANIGKIKHEIVDWIRFVLQSGSYGQSFASMKKGEDNSASGRPAVGFNQ